MANDRQSSSQPKVGRYDPRAVEMKWARVWNQVKLDQTDIVGAPRPFYNLMMFPYPSAEGLHVGNMYAFTGADIYGRFKRMQGFEVFEPIGLDGFGIHSENYAFKVGRHPADQAAVSQKKFYEQLNKIGAMYDWSRTLVTYDPDYYRWTQWIFVQMFKHGLAHRAKAQVNWCPDCKTVLADEQVIEGRCERCGNIVEKRLLDQWFFRITAYAGKLLENLDRLDWSEKVKVAQRNWIGRKEGINITYPVVTSQAEKVADITCFTTRPDTNFGATFVVVAPEHDFVTKLFQKDFYKVQPFSEGLNLHKVQEYIKAAKKKSAHERITEGRKKTGVFTGLYCVNQLNNNKIPLYISDFILMEVGTGAVVGVPGHDRRDFEFAQAMKLPLRRVVVGPDRDTSEITRIEQVQEEEGIMVNSGFLNGLDIRQAIEKMMDYLEKKGWGERIATYHLRDWLISRQRYWGPPIPMVFCQKCASAGKSWFTTEEAKHALGNPKSQTRLPAGQVPMTKQIQHSTSKTLEIGNWKLEIPAESAGWYPVPEDQLPVLLPRIEDYKPTGEGVAPLARHKEFYETTCPGCGRPAIRETEVSDTFLDSSWYYLRYPSVNVGNPKSQIPMTKQAQNSKPKSLEIGNWKLEIPWDPEIAKKWLPVDMYTGGAEHSVLHLMYSRFITMALCDMGYLDFDEPFTRFYAHGLVIKDGAKMSKSKGNIVNPDEYIARYGADSLRLYLMFMGPFDQGGDFRDSAMEGMHRWINRVWRLITAQIPNPKSQIPNKSKIQNSKPEIKQALHRLIKKVTEDIEKRRYNTAIAAMMEFTNLVQDQGGLLDQAELKTFILLLAPFAPYLAEELWQRIRSFADGRWKIGLEGGRLDALNMQNFKKSKPQDQKRLTSNFKSIHKEPWPRYDPQLLAEETVEIVVQVNGKLRDTIKVESEKCKVQNEVEVLARGSEKVSRLLEGRTVKRVIFVPGCLVNYVV